MQLQVITVRCKKLKPTAELHNIDGINGSGLT